MVNDRSRTGEAPTTASRPGRPPRSETQIAILDAARELLADHGVHGMTVEGVAARAGVAKTTIYRRYRSKDELALAVLIDMVEHVAAAPDADDTRQELTAFVDRAVKILGKTLMGRVMQGLVSDLATVPTLAQAFRDRVVATRVTEVKRLVDRGIARGDLRPDTDYELANELLFGPVYYRLLLSGGRLDSKLAPRIVDAFLAAFGADRR
jgi:AcrR family transcriptional regulator